MKNPVCIIVFFVLAACQSAGRINETLDTRSGLTLVTANEPMTFARTQGQFSRSARDYLYLAPVEINERGALEYYLWVGVASTLDRDYVAAAELVPEQLVLAVDGTPMEFSLAPWDERLPRLAGRPVYTPVVTPERVLSARVTLDQLARIAGGTVTEVRVEAGEAAAVTYFLWDDRAWWPGFPLRKGGR